MPRRVTLEDVITRAKKIHGDKYSYGKSVYKSMKTKMTVTCPIHGDFEITPDNLLHGQGCKKCADDAKRMTLDEFIERAMAIYGDWYMYDKTVYFDSVTPVTVTCRKHGDISVNPSMFLGGHGCKECANESRREKLRDTLDNFITKARNVHGDKYDYSQVVYIDCDTEVIIICPVHGPFKQKPRCHLEGRGCRKCGREAVGERLLKTQEQFIAEAIAIYGDMYTYGKTIYKGRQTPVTVTCLKHGDFEIIPDSFLRGHGCKKCGIELRSEKIRDSREDFIVKARKVHGDKYDYSKVVYIDDRTPVEIICPEHGSFWQLPKIHKQGFGCKKCHKSRMEKEVINLLDDMRIDYIHQCGKGTFAWLGKQSFDFYLPDYNVAIECQGQQHYFPVDFAGEGQEWAEQNFKYVRELDERKAKLCEEHCVRLYYIRYDDKIEDELNNILKECRNGIMD